MKDGGKVKNQLNQVQNYLINEIMKYKRKNMKKGGRVRKFGGKKKWPVQV